MIIWRTRVSTLPDADDDVRVAGLPRSPRPPGLAPSRPAAIALANIPLARIRWRHVCVAIIDVADSVQRKHCSMAWVDVNLLFVVDTTGKVIGTKFWNLARIKFLVFSSRRFRQLALSRSSTRATYDPTANGRSVRLNKILGARRRLWRSQGKFSQRHSGV